MENWPHTSTLLVLPLSFLASRSVSVPFQFPVMLSIRYTGGAARRRAYTLICRQEIVLINKQLVTCDILGTTGFPFGCTTFPGVCN